MHKAVTEGFVILTLRFHQEGRCWVGECEELGTATDGRSLVKVRSELERFVALHLDGLEDADERERFFLENGIKLYPEDLPATVSRELPVSHDGDMLIEVRTIPLFERRHDVAGMWSVTL